MAIFALRGRIYYLLTLEPVIHRNHAYMAMLIIYTLVVVYYFVGLTRAVLRSELHTSGPYRFYAHPAYLTYALGDLFLISIMTTSITPFNAITSLMLNVFLLLTSYYEERQLIEKFGDKAISYLDRTMSMHKVAALLKS